MVGVMLFGLTSFLMCILNESLRLQLSRIDVSFNLNLSLTDLSHVFSSDRICLISFCVLQRIFLICDC